MTIEELAADYHRKEQTVEMLAMRNVSMNPEQSRKDFIEYSKARAEAYEARRELEAAICGHK